MSSRRIGSTLWQQKRGAAQIFRRNGSSMRLVPEVEADCKRTVDGKMPEYDEIFDSMHPNTQTGHQFRLVLGSALGMAVFGTYYWMVLVKEPGRRKHVTPTKIGEEKNH